MKNRPLAVLLASLGLLVGCSEKPDTATSTAATAPATTAASGSTAPATQPPLVTKTDAGQKLTGAVSDLSGLIGELEGKQTAAGLTFTFNADVLFDFDKADIKPEALPTLGKLAQVVREAKQQRLTIKGYTDAKGEEMYNLNLSQRRAQAIADWLRQNGAPTGPVQVQGLGEANPVAPNTTPDGRDNPEGRQQNRRVEVILS